MQQTRLHLTAAALMALCTGCSTTAPGLATVPPSGVAGSIVRLDEAVPSILEFPAAGTDELWRALPISFELVGIPAGVMDRAARVYGNPGVRVSAIAGKPTRSLFRCTNEGTGMSSMTQYRIEFGIAAQPRALTGGGAELIVQTQALGRFVDASRSGTIHCVSNGMIEGMLKQQIEAELERMRK